MFDESPKKFDRIVAILIQLQSKKVVKAQDLAARFGVSLRTIYRDIRSLEASGVPVYGEAGTGYSLVDGYRLPPVMFTREEAGSFIAAEKLMQHFTDKELGSYYESALYKIRAVLSHRDKEWIDQIESKVVMQPAAGRLFNENVPNALSVILQAVANKTAIDLDYKTFDAEFPTTRRVESVGVFHDHNNWYLMAYCLLRKDYRQFRTDRILGIRKTDIPFHKEHKSLEYYLQPKKEYPTTPIAIRVDKAVAKYLAFERKYHGFISEKPIGNQIEMHFICSSVEGFCRWFMMFADAADIVEPALVKEKINHLLTAFQNRLSPTKQQNP